MALARSLLFCVLVLCGFFYSTAATAAEETALKRFSLPGKGFLEMQVPRKWLEIVRQPTDQGPPTIVFAPLHGLQFEVSVTPSWQPASGDAASGQKALRQRVEGLLESIRPNVVEKDLRIIPFQGSPGSGFYFSGTDKSPKPMDYKFVTQGMLDLPRISVSFTVLTHDGQRDVVAAALAMLKSARYSPPRP